MSISVDLNSEETKLVETYAAEIGVSVSELFRQTVIEHIEDMIDLQDGLEALEEYKQNPVTYTLDEIEEELGI